MWQHTLELSNGCGSIHKGQALRVLGLPNLGAIFKNSGRLRAMSEALGIAGIIKIYILARCRALMLRI